MLERCTECCTIDICIVRSDIPDDETTPNRLTRLFFDWLPVTACGVVTCSLLTGLGAIFTSSGIIRIVHSNSEQDLTTGIVLTVAGTIHTLGVCGLLCAPLLKQGCSQLWNRYFTNRESRESINTIYSYSNI